MSKFVSYIIVKQFLQLIIIFTVTFHFVSAQTKSDNKLIQSKSAEFQNTVVKNIQGEEFIFRPNRGQWQDEILYRTYQGNQNISFLKEGISFGKRTAEKGFFPEPGKEVQLDYHFWEIGFENANQEVQIVAEDFKNSNIHYFGPSNPDGASIPSYRKLKYKQLWDGIDMVFYNSDATELKYDFVVAPKASLEQIQLKYKGVKSLQVNRNGQLEIETTEGIYKEDKPVAWQIIQGKKMMIDIAYKVVGNTLSYVAGSYNPDYELIIDPVYLDWSTYFYGLGWNSSTTFRWTWVLDIDIDFNDHVYVTGMTTDWFPYFPNAYDTSLAGFYDAFVCKMTQDGDSMLFFSYIGGNSYEYSLSMTVNENEEPVISGITYSKDYPVTKNAFDTITRNCGSSTWCLTGFVTKFNKTGTGLVYSTYLGGDNFSSGWNIDWIRGMTMNKAGEVFVVGNTNSTDFPVTSGAYQTTNKGGSSTSYYLSGDAFLTKFKADGSGIVFSTFIGGTNGDVAYDVILSSKEEIYVVGYTASTNFPTTPGSKIFNTFVKGTSDAFFAKFKPDGSNIIYAKLMGGNGEDVFEGMYINEQDELYVGGYTNSSDFYTTTNAYQKVNRGGYDFVVVKILSAGTNVTYSTYLGGTGQEYIYNYPYFSTIKIAANVREEAIVCGITGSKDFPITTDAIQPVNNTVSWGFGGTLCMAKLSMAGDKLLYGSYYGGSRIEYPGGIRVKRTGCVTNIVFGGLTQSIDYPTSPGSFRDTAKKSNWGWTYSGFVSKFRDTLKTDLISLTLQDSVVECDKVFEILDAQNQGADFKWSHGPKSRFVILEKPGEYWVEATYGCDTVRDTIDIRLHYSPTVPILPADSIYCNSFPGLTLDAQNDTIHRKYLWSTLDSSRTINVSDTGLYIVQIQTPHCGTKSDSIHLSLLHTPKVDLPKDSIFCDSVNISLDAGNSWNKSVYVWSHGDSLQSTVLDTVGIYRITVINKCGSAVDSMKISQLYTPAVQLPSDSTYCGPFDLTLKAGRKQNDEIYNWSDALLKILYGGDDSLKVDFTGYFKLEIENKCGVAADSVKISALKIPELYFPDSLVYCDKVEQGIRIGNPKNQEQYLWSNSSTSDSTFFNNPGWIWANIRNYCGEVRDSILLILKHQPVITIPDDTIFCNSVSYAVSAAINDAETRYFWNGLQGGPSHIFTTEGMSKIRVENRCGIFEDSFHIDLIKTPQVELGNDVHYCGGVLPTELTVGDPDNLETYLWSNNSTLNKTTFGTPGKVTVTITNQCGIATDSLEIMAIDFPVVDLGEDTVLCGNFNLTLDAGGDGISYVWSPGNETTRMINANQQTTYKVRVTNAFGCATEDELKIGNDCISSYHIPTAFTPNNDLLNEVFKPTLVNYEGYELKIINRWGEMVFQTQNPEKGWDGTYNGEACQPGQYFYIITFITTENMQYRQIAGAVTLLK